MLVSVIGETSVYMFNMNSSFHSVIVFSGDHIHTHTKLKDGCLRKV